MKVLLLARWYPNDEDPQLGVFIQKHAQTIASFAEVCVVAAFPRVGLKETRVVRNVQAGLREYVVYYPARSTVFALPAYFRAMQMAIRSGVQEIGKPDLIHAHVLLRTFVMAGFLACRWNVPYFITEHWTGYLHGGFNRKSFIYKQITRYIIRKARAVSLVSASLVQAFEQCSLRNHDIRIIPNVVDIPEQMRKPEHREILHILTVADLSDKNKNISGVLRVLDQLSPELPEFRYTVVGGGPDEAALKALAHSLTGITDRVHFTGRVPNEEVFRYLDQADFLIVNSHVETFSVVTAEALAMGVPVIGTISGGPEFIIKPENGILIPSDNPIALADAVRAMAVGFPHYNADQMRESVRAVFSRETLANAFKAMYTDYLKT